MRRLRLPQKPSAQPHCDAVTAPSALSCGVSTQVETWGTAAVLTGEHRLQVGLTERASDASVGKPLQEICLKAWTWPAINSRIWNVSSFCSMSKLPEISRSFPGDLRHFDSVWHMLELYVLERPRTEPPHTTSFYNYRQLFWSFW